MASAPDPITSPPDVPGQPYDATEDGTVGKWVSVNSKGGPVDIATGRTTGDFPSGDGGWEQT